MIEQYQLPVSSMKFCPDCDYEDNTTDLVMKHMVDEHKETSSISNRKEKKDTMQECRFTLSVILQNHPMVSISKLCDLE